MKHSPDSADTVDNKKPRFLEEAEHSTWDAFNIWGPVTLLTLTGFIVAWMFVEPAPPDYIKIATGAKSGAYYETAQKYAEIFKQEGIDVEIIETAGTVENYELLLEDNDVHLAIVQGGSKPETLSGRSVEAIASLYFEPLWIFTSAETDASSLNDLVGKRINIGPPGSGTEALMVRLLASNGLVDPVSGNPIDGQITISRESNSEALNQLKGGSLDGLCVVTSPTSPLLRQMFAMPEIKLMPFRRNETYRLLFPALSAITLQEGIINLRENRPETGVPLLAPVANMVCTAELHDAFIPVLCKAANQVHAEGNLLVPPGEFPSLEYIEYDAHPAAVDFFESGPSFLNRYLPFWVASFLNRTKILLVPLLTLAIPLIKLAPPIYRWQIRSRIYRWYGTLRKIDQEQLRSNNPADKERLLKTLDRISTELSEVNVPLSYMEEFYNLHMHIELVRGRIKGWELGTEEDKDDNESDEGQG